MKLLFDNNISFKLVSRLKNVFPHSSHVMFEQLDSADDLIIWNFAKENEFVIVTKDNDFNEISVLKGFPPKIIWLRTGNCRINQIEDMLLKNRNLLKEFSQNLSKGLIQIQ